MKLTKQKLSKVIKFYSASLAHEQVLHQIQGQEHIATQAAITAFMLCSPERLEGKGVYVNYDFEVGGDEKLVTVYIGLYGAGIIATYYASSDEWHECQSHGNFGNNFASGGTWSVTTKHKSGAKYIPQIIELIVKGI